MAFLISIDDATVETLKELALAEGKPIGTVIKRAVVQYRRRAFLEGLNADFRELKANEKEWNREQAERALWEGTTSDGY